MITHFFFMVLTVLWAPIIWYINIMLSCSKLMVICMISQFTLDGYHTEKIWKVVGQGQTSGEKALELVGLREANKGCGHCRAGLDQKASSRGRGWYPEHDVHHKVTQKQITKVFSSNYYVVLQKVLLCSSTFCNMDQGYYSGEAGSSISAWTTKWFRHPHIKRSLG